MRILLDANISWKLITTLKPILLINIKPMIEDLKNNDYGLLEIIIVCPLPHTSQIKTVATTFSAIGRKDSQQGAIEALIKSAMNDTNFLSENAKN
jgi:hypothetical protein